MGIVDAVLGSLERLRLSALVPRLDIAVEGGARICASDHLMMGVGGSTIPSGPVHVDVSVEVWNKGQHPISLIEVRRAEAGGQGLVLGNSIGSAKFRQVTLDPHGPKTAVHFALSPASGEQMVAGLGDQVEFHFRMSRNGRDRRVKLPITD